MNLAYDVIYPPGDKQQNLPPIVMLHGMLDFRKTWQKVAPKIAQNTGRIVYLLDERNHGESPWSSEMDWDVLANDIGDFLLQRGIPKAVLIGHSMGGRAAFTFALKKPEMVDKLIVEDIAVRSIRIKDGSIIMNLISLMRESLNCIPSGADELTAKKAVIEYMGAFIPEGQNSSFSSKIDMNFVPLKKDGDIIKWQANLDALENLLTTEKLTHDVTKLGIYNGDVMFLYGTKSFFRINRDPWIEKLFPRAVKVPFEGANHLIHHVFPEKFSKVVTDFINKGLVPTSKI